MPPRLGGSLPGILYIEVDGTAVLMTPAETAGRVGKGDDGRTHSREVKLACRFTHTRLDVDGRPLADRGSVSYLASFQPAEEFGALVAAAAIRSGSRHIRQVTVIGDGAKWIWNLASARFPRPPRDRGPLPRP